MINSTDSNSSTEEIASNVRWLLELKRRSPRNSVMLRRALGLTEQRARDLYFGRVPYTVAELTGVREYLQVSMAAILDGDFRDEAVGLPNRIAQAAAENDRKFDHLTGVGDNLAALLWAAANDPDLDDLMFHAIDFDLPKGTDATSYCIVLRAALVRLGRHLRVHMPSRPSIA